MLYSSSDTLLAIDTASPCCAVALQYQGAVFSDGIDAQSSHGEQVLNLLDKVITQAGLSPPDLMAQLDAVVVSRGPGSFTGVRIGVAAAQGLAYGSSVPLIGVSSLAAMAHSALAAPCLVDATELAILVAVDARMDELYWALYYFKAASMALVLGPRVGALNQLVDQLHARLDGGPLVAVADERVLASFDSHLPSFTPLSEQVDARHLLRLVAKDDVFLKQPMASEHAGIMIANQGDALEPLYLRNDVAWEKRTKIRQTADCGNI